MAAASFRAQWRLSLLVLACFLACAACGSRAVVDGKLIGSAGRTDATCEVELHDEVGDPGSGLRCHEAGTAVHAPDTSVVRIGQGFECVGVATPGEVDVTASCDGYEPYRSPPFKWSGGGEVQHLGDIVLRPAAAPDPR